MKFSAVWARCGTYSRPSILVSSLSFQSLSRWHFYRRQTAKFSEYVTFSRMLSCLRFPCILQIAKHCQGIDIRSDYKADERTLGIWPLLPGPKDFWWNASSSSSMSPVLCPTTPSTALLGRQQDWGFVRTTPAEREGEPGAAASCLHQTCLPASRDNTTGTHEAPVCYLFNILTHKETFSMVSNLIFFP